MIDSDLYATISPVSHTSSWSSIRSDISQITTSSKGSTSSFSSDDLDESSPWYAKNVLSLDGGGVRSLTTLLIIGMLMKYVAFVEQNFHFLKEDEYFPNELWTNFNDETTNTELWPCHYFDYISGTGTGGLVAIMLGRLRMTVPKATEHLLKILGGMLGRAGQRTWLNHARKVRRKMLRNDVKQMVANLQSPLQTPLQSPLQSPQQSPHEDRHSLLSDIVRCRTIVFAMKGNVSQGGNMVVHAFRSYQKCDDDGPEGDNLEEVVLRSIATTPAFATYSSDGNNFLDASVSMTNPTRATWMEVCLQHLQYGGTGNPIDVLLSIGSSINTTITAPQRGKYDVMHTNSVRRKFDQYMSLLSAYNHAKMDGIAKKATGTSYYRLEPQHGLETVGSHDWQPKLCRNNTVETIEKATQQYLELDSTKAALQACAESLVRRRHLRETTDEWQGFAFGIKYRCRLSEDGPCSVKYFDDRHAMLDHLQIVHKFPPLDEENLTEVQAILDKCRDVQK